MGERGGCFFIVWLVAEEARYPSEGQGGRLTKFSAFDWVWRFGNK
jgi:hypothetical protein